MPGKRAKNKVRFGGYVDSKVYLEIAQLAAEEGMCHDKCGFLKRLICEALGLVLAASLPANAQPAVNATVSPPSQLLMGQNGTGTTASVTPSANGQSATVPVPSIPAPVRASAFGGHGGAVAIKSAGNGQPIPARPGPSLVRAIDAAGRNSAMAMKSPLINGRPIPNQPSLSPGKGNGLAGQPNTGVVKPAAVSETARSVPPHPALSPPKKSAPGPVATEPRTATSKPTYAKQTRRQ